MKILQVWCTFYLPKYKVLRTKDVTSPTWKTVKLVRELRLCFKQSKSHTPYSKSLQQFRGLCLWRKGTKSFRTHAEPSNRWGFQSESFARRWTVQLRLHHSLLLLQRLSCIAMEFHLDGESVMFKMQCRKQLSLYIEQACFTRKANNHHSNQEPVECKQCQLTRISFR